MTDIELQKRKRACTYGSREYAELSCIEMINSILCYTCRGFTDAEKVLSYEEGAYYNFLESYTKKLGRQRVLELIQGQIDSIVGVEFAGYDSEGGAYYGLVFA